MPYIIIARHKTKIIRGKVKNNDQLRAVMPLTLKIKMRDSATLEDANAEVRRLNARTHRDFIYSVGIESRKEEEKI